MNEQFYDSMADYYHLIFEDWDASMRRQGAALAKLLPPPEEVGLILDVACGIGTQSLALAAIGTPWRARIYLPLKLRERNARPHHVDSSVASALTTCGH